jgi:hypothetical protein
MARHGEEDDGDIGGDTARRRSAQRHGRRSAELHAAASMVAGPA